jgi:PPM family protein phosphatase
VAPNPAVNVQPGNAQALGRRAEQQDAFGFGRFDDPTFLAHGGHLAVLADGIGGMQDGGDAARRAVLEFIASYAAKPADEPIPAALDRALEAANREVYELAQARAGEGQCGTTVVAAVVHDDWLHWVAVGDSRLYHVARAEGQPRQLNTDHNYATELDRGVATGHCTPEEAAQHHDRGALTSFLGLAEIPEVDRPEHPVALARGDRVLLCSDGVYRTLTVAELGALLALPAQVAAEQLIARVTDAADPYQDNATVALLALDPEPVSTPRSPPPRRRVRPLFWAALALTALLAAAFHGWLRERLVLPFAPAGLPAIPGSVPAATTAPFARPETTPWETSEPTSSAAPATPTLPSPTRP